MEKHTEAREAFMLFLASNYRDGSIQKFVIFLVRSAKQHFRDKKYRIRSTTPAVALDQRRRLTLSWKLRTHRGGWPGLSLKGSSHKIFFSLNFIFWITMGCGVVRLGWKGLKTTWTWNFWSQSLSPWDLKGCRTSHGPMAPPLEVQFQSKKFSQEQVFLVQNTISIHVCIFSPF